MIVFTEFQTYDQKNKLLINYNLNFLCSKQLFEWDTFLLTIKLTGWHWLFPNFHLPGNTKVFIEKVLIKISLTLFLTMGILFSKIYDKNYRPCYQFIEISLWA